MITLANLDLDELRRNYVRLYYFGLGFIQLKLNESERLHFYSPRLPAITEDPHTHRYGFLSRILKGELTNHVYGVKTFGNVSPLGTHTIAYESCNPNVKADGDAFQADVKLIDSTTYGPGESYVVTDDMFHSVEPGPKGCITYLLRTNYKARFAQVARQNGDAQVCPFSRQVPEEELWTIMRELVESV